MAKIFISYRRADSGWQVDEIAAALRAVLTGPDDELFIDIDSIPLGANFESFIASKIDGCSHFLVVIGPRWMSTESADGSRRLDDPNDYVRIEIAAALRRGVPVVPILVDGAPLPETQALPHDLAALPKHNGINFSRLSRKADIEHLIRRLELNDDRGRSLPSSKNRPGLEWAQREVIVGGVSRHLSDWVVIAPPIPSGFDMAKGPTALYPTVGYRCEQFAKVGEFVDFDQPLWKYWSWPPALGPISMGTKGGMDAIVSSPARGLLVTMTYNGMGDLAAYRNDWGEAAFLPFGFMIVLFDGDEQRGPDWKGVFHHLVYSLRTHFDLFMPGKLRGQRPNGFAADLDYLDAGNLWTGSLYETPQRFRSGFLNMHADAVKKAHTETFLKR